MDHVGRAILDSEKNFIHLFNFSKINFFHNGILYFHILYETNIPQFDVKYQVLSKQF